MFFIYFYLQRQRSHMAIDIPDIMKLIPRAITERAALDERTAVVGRHARARTHTHTHTHLHQTWDNWCQSCLCQTCKDTLRLASHGRSVGINAFHRPRYYLQG
jgi:hypothetical protein